MPSCPSRLPMGPLWEHLLVLTNPLAASSWRILHLREVCSTSLARRAGDKAGENGNGVSDANPVMLSAFLNFGLPAKIGIIGGCTHRSLNQRQLQGQNDTAY